MDSAWDRGIGYNINGQYSMVPKPPRYYEYPDASFHGVVATASAGYLFKPKALHVNIELIYEANIFKKQELNMLALRL
jgi:hypothetical protein